MADLGFWSIAAEDPGHLAVVDPDGTEISAGELLGSANQLVHGLRQLGLEPGDSIAMVLPNGAEVFELYLAVLQAGWYLIPINHHLVAPEIAYIVQDCDAKVFVAHERFADACAAAAKELGFPEDRSFAVGTVPGFRPYEELKAGQPTALPSDRR
ncbi:MAG TPA: AMP-binding protein, partial [Acidimicrobiales bacterium]